MNEHKGRKADRFPRASRYNPEWVMAGVSGAANPLWMTEWLTEVLDLKPGMRVLDLGCGRAVSSIFLRREFGVSVWAVDLWFDASENFRRIRDAGVDDGVFPLRADARALPFPAQYFDVIVSIDSFFYYGTDDHYLNYVARFLKSDGSLGIAGAGLMQELDGPVPEHLRDWWTPDLWCLHSAPWWRRHWERTGLVDVRVADSLPSGWELWLAWLQAINPENDSEIRAVSVDGGRNLGYVRTVGQRRENAHPTEPVASVPSQYTKKPIEANVKN